ncbi:MAG: HEPN domain-containing protein [Bacteroidota bacterium]|nr:HEPN domain-containing protein [Bacteroidota bacterium]
MKIKLPDEWFKQADYDFKTAEAMLESRRYVYVVFMCHLSIEKALKGVFAKVYNENPVRTHNLLYLLNKIQEKTDFDIDGDNFEVIKVLNSVSVPTRYPEDLYELLKDFKLKETKKLITQTSKLLKWLKEKL